MPAKLLLWSYYHSNLACLAHLNPDKIYTAIPGFGEEWDNTDPQRHSQQMQQSEEGQESLPALPSRHNIQHQHTLNKSDYIERIYTYRKEKRQQWWTGQIKVSRKLGSRDATKRICQKKFNPPSAANQPPPPPTFSPKTTTSTTTMLYSQPHNHFPSAK